jgi:hypothetical protein
MPRLGVIGSMVWDEIHGRDPAAPPTEEWGGIAYSLAGLDAALADGWEIVPLIKVGRDLSVEADRFLKTLVHRRADTRFIEVPTPNNRVVLRYHSSERRCERMSGGVPAWTWQELGPLVRDLDAIYVNLISGFELTLGAATALRSGFAGPIYADLHSLLLGMGQDGLRNLQPLPDAPGWYRCFDFIQVNEDEMQELSEDPMALAVEMMDAGASSVIVTLGPRGAVFFDTGRWSPAGRGPGGGPIRTARLDAVPVDAIDPTGCGDVFGATVCARILAGDSVEVAVKAGNRAAARNAGFRGAGGLASHLRGSLVLT